MARLTDSVTNRSLYRFLSGIIVAVVLVVLGLQSLVSYRDQRQQALQEINDSSSRSIQRLQKNIAPFIESYEVNEYVKLLTNEIEVNHHLAITVSDRIAGNAIGQDALISGKVIDANGAIIDYNPDDGSQRDQLAKAFFKKSVDITSSSGEILGTFTIYDTDEKLQAALNGIILRNLISSLLISTLLITLLLLTIHHLLVRKMNLIAKVISHADADGIPLEPVPNLPFREVATLTETINNMVGVVKLARDSLQVEREHLRNVIDGTRVGTWEWNVQTGETIFNERWAQIIGYNLEEIQPTSIETWMKFAHPDDLKVSGELLEKHFSGVLPYYEREARMRHKDGHWVWVLDRGKVSTWTVDGKPLLMSGTHQDITERKNAEEELRLAHAVYQNSSEAMVICDADNRIVAINPAFTVTTGYRAEEVIGKNPKILSSGRQGAEFYRDMWHAIDTTGQWQGEIWNRHKNGEEYAEWLTINTIYGEDGSIHRRIALFSDITEKKKADALIWMHANHDLLTNLPNRRLFTDRLEREIVQAHRNKSLFALLFIDLDRFKEVNDTLGHHMGDELLVEAAKRIQRCVRETDTVARLGGDEFTVILSEISEPSTSGRIAQNILDALALPFQLGMEQVYVSASIGITFYPDDAKTVAGLLQNADQAMYSAKQQGRNCFSCFTPALQEAATIRMRLARDLRVALADNQFQAYFQPIVELETGSIHKAEALLRWKHPVHGYISPAAFIPIAEETGVINDIGDWIFHQAVNELVKLRELVDIDFQISVNKSPVQFRTLDAVHNHWGEYLFSHGIPGNSIVVEITEGLLLNAEKSIQDQLFHLRDRGIQVAIDDFGTGYSALSYLQKFDIDYLKIDQSFTRNLEQGNENVALCEAIVIMAHKLGLKVIAEGIETEPQRDLLKSMGCDYGQGYLFSKPLPVEEFEKLVVNY